MIRTSLLISIWLGLAPFSNADQAEGARRIQFLNYPDCIELRNEAGTLVVLGHHVGGRVLSYSHQGPSLSTSARTRRSGHPGGTRSRRVPDASTSARNT